MSAPIDICRDGVGLYFCGFSIEMHFFILKNRTGSGESIKNSRPADVMSLCCF